MTITTNKTTPSRGARVRRGLTAAAVALAGAGAVVAPAADAKPANGSTYAISSLSYDGQQTTTLTGVNDQGKVLEGTVGPATAFPDAALQKFAHGGCRDAATAWNQAVGLDQHRAVLFQLALYGCKVRLTLDRRAGAFKLVQPVA